MSKEIVIKQRIIPDLKIAHFYVDKRAYISIDELSNDGVGLCIETISVPELISALTELSKEK